MVSVCLAAQAQSGPALELVALTQFTAHGEQVRVPIELRLHGEADAEPNAQPIFGVTAGAVEGVYHASARGYVGELVVPGDASGPVVVLAGVETTAGFVYTSTTFSLGGDRQPAQRIVVAPGTSRIEAGSSGQIAVAGIDARGAPLRTSALRCAAPWPHTSAHAAGEVLVFTFYVPSHAVGEARISCADELGNHAFADVAIIARHSADGVRDVARAELASPTLEPIPPPPSSRLSARLGLMSDFADVTGPRLAASYESPPLAVAPRARLGAELALQGMQRDGAVAASGGSLTIERQTVYCDALAMAGWTLAEGARWRTTPRLGLGLGVIGHRSRIAGQHAVNETGWAPIAQLGITLALGLGETELLIEAGGSWRDHRALRGLDGTLVSGMLQVGLGLPGP